MRFHQVESNFHTANVTAELIKYHHVAANSDSTVINQMSHLIKSLDPIAPYTTADRFVFGH